MNYYDLVNQFPNFSLEDKAGLLRDSIVSKSPEKGTVGRGSNSLKFYYKKRLRKKEEGSSKDYSRMDSWN